MSHGLSRETGDALEIAHIAGEERGAEKYRRGGDDAVAELHTVLAPEAACDGTDSRIDWDEKDTVQHRAQGGIFAGADVRLAKQFDLGYDRHIQESA